MLEEIAYQNPWWTSGHVAPDMLGKIKRVVFTDIKESLVSKKVSCIYGPRRSGKSMLMMALIDHLLSAEVPRNRIMYVSMDNSKVRMDFEHDFDEFIKGFIREVSGDSPNSIKDRIYIFLDEVHKLDDWGNKIKYWQDLGFKIKFVISGSSTNKILKGSGESLQGRIEFYLVLPLLFCEFADLRISADIMDYNAIEKISKDMVIEKIRVLTQFEKYILKGGFPEVFEEPDLEKAFQRLRLYKTLAINKEILEMRDIKEPRVLNDLFDMLSDYMSERVNYTYFSKNLNVKFDTVKTYMTYLEEAMLIYPAYQFNMKHIVSTRKEKKLYFFDHGLRNSLLLKEITDLERTKIMENIIFIHLFHRMRADLLPKVFFWQNASKHEVDFIIRINKKNVPIEVKYTDRISSADEKTIREFMNEFECATGIIVTKDILEERGALILIPAWLFTLMI